MNKFKKIMLGALSVLTLGLFVVTGAKVNAADESFLASSLTTTSFSSGNTVKDGTNYTLSVTGVAATVQSCTSTNTADNKSYSRVLYASGTTTANEKGFTLTSKSNDIINFTVYYTISSGDWSNTSSKSGDIAIGSTNGTDSNKKSGGTAYKATGTLAAKSSVILASTSQRLAIFEIEINVLSAKTVTFESMGGSNVVSQEVAVGSKATEPTAPTWSGHIFLCWNTRSGSGTELDPYTYTEFKFDTTNITDDIILYATWAEGTEYTVTFVSETYESSIIKKVIDGQNNNLVTGWPSNPEKLGYNFDGWYSGDDLYTSTTTINSTVTLTARFSLYVVSIDSESKLDIASINSTLTGSADNFQSGKFVVVEGTKATGLQATTNGSINELNFNTNDYRIYVGFYIPANSIAKVAICGRSAKADNTSQLTVKNGSTTQDIQFASNSSYKTHMVNVINSTSEDQLVYVYRSNGTGSNVCTLNVKVVENVDNIAKNALVNIDAEMNTDKSVLRLITTISGVELADIESIELVLLKDGVATNEPVYVSTVYTSVSGAADLYEEATNTYFGITKITSAQSIKNSVITMSVIVTYTGDVTCTSVTKTFTVPEA